jgi:hypothetical protein
MESRWPLIIVAVVGVVAFVVLAAAVAALIYFLTRNKNGPANRITGRRE